MLYPQNTSPELSSALFANPGSEYRGAPFWAWNCKLEEKELLRQLDVFKQMGMGGAHMHVRTGLATPYLSAEHLHMVSACVEKCRREGMLAWLYDEDRWPSGAAGGLVTRDIRYRARQLLFTARPYGSNHAAGQNFEMSGKSVRTDNGTLLACYDVVLDDNGCLASAKRIAETDEARGRKWYAYLETALPNPWYNNQTYVNTLDKAAIERFVEVTHERYFEKVGKDFGGVIPAIFTDEPQFAHKGTLGFSAEAKDVILPWTEDVPDTFRAAYGEEILEYLPQLLWELPDGRVSVIRYHYHDHIAERFSAAFADTVGGWCQRHGLMLTGHMMEEPTLESQTSALGEAMRSYRSFQLPGIDMLCARYEFTTAKQAQSAAHQYGRPGVLSELYGVTGWAYDFRGHKLQGDWQAALGVTVRVPHLSWASMKGEAKRDYPASIFYQSPWWKDYSFVENHFARVNTALTRGKPVVKVGVIHPIESYWLHWGPASQTHGIREQLDEQFQNVTQWLVTGGIDFDFISESLFPSLCKDGSAPMQVGEMRYDAIVVPGCETLRSSTLDRLEAFRRSGGELIFLGNAPALADALPSQRGDALYARSKHAVFSREALMEALKDVRLIDIRNQDGTRTENLLHQLREDHGDLWLFVAHSVPPVNKDTVEGQPIRITLKGEYAAKVYDTQTGEIRAADCETAKGRTTVYATLESFDSLLLRLTPGKASRLAAAPTAKTRPIDVPELVDYVLSEPNVLLLDQAEYALDDGELEPKEELLRADNAMRAKLNWPSRRGAVAQPWTLQEEPAAHKARLRFEIFSEIDLRGAKLALEDADAAKLRLNGELVECKPDGWYVDKSIGTIALPALTAGVNRLEIEVPFGRRTSIEWCYLLGDFGVDLQGTRRTLTKRPDKLGFDSVTVQRFPHYGGNMEYRIPLECHGGSVTVCVPHYVGTALRIAVDGAAGSVVAYPPYRLALGRLAAGKHMLSITLLGNRENAFGPLHRAYTTDPWTGPDAWRTTGIDWTYSYRLTPLGVMTAPLVEESLDE